LLLLLLPLLLQLVVTPPLISTSVFVTVIHMLVMMCIGCPDLAVVLLKLSQFSHCSVKGPWTPTHFLKKHNFLIILTETLAPSILSTQRNLHLQSTLYKNDAENALP